MSPQIGWIDTNNKNVLFDDALKIAKQEGSWANTPYEILILTRVQVEKERPDSISVTQLLGCARKVFLEANNDYYISPADNWPAVRGSIIHAMLETVDDDRSDTEVRYEREHRGVKISGQPDTVRVIGSGKKKKIVDWKTTAKLPFYDTAWLSHRQQVSIYRWLLGLEARFTDLSIVYLAMDGYKEIFLKKGGTTKHGRSIVSEVMSDEEVETFLDDRLMVLDAQRKAGKPISYSNVPEADLWQCNYCPVRPVCYKLAGEEAKAAFLAGESVNRITPREVSKKK